jgi:hypothetical protein
MRPFPDVLKKLHALRFEYPDGDSIDFYPRTEFVSDDERRSWFKAWTGNDRADPSHYLVFGEDGTGGMAAFWLVRDGADLLNQPIVFFGSEGELGVVASNFGGYLRLLANGIGPYEAVAFKGLDRPVHPEFARFALAEGVDLQQPVWAVVDAAQTEFPGFESDIRALCDYPE